MKKRRCLMPLWCALVLGVLAWTPIAFVLASLLGHCMRGDAETD